MPEVLHSWQTAANVVAVAFLVGFGLAAGGWLWAQIVADRRKRNG